MATRTQTCIFITLMLALSNLLAEESKIQTTELKGDEVAHFLKERTKTEVNEIAKGKCISIAIQNSLNQHGNIESVQLFLVRPTGKKEVDVDVFEWTQGTRSDGDVNVLFNITDKEVAGSYLVFRERKFDDAEQNSSREIRTTIRLKSMLAATIDTKKP